jgi:hypothetical protein
MTDNTTPLTYTRVSWVGVSDTGIPIASAFTFEDLKAGIDEYYGIGKDPKAQYNTYVPHYSKYPDTYEGYLEYTTDDYNGGTEIEEVHIYCIDFYPVTRYTK